MRALTVTVAQDVNISEQVTFRSPSDFLVEKIDFIEPSFKQTLHINSKSILRNCLNILLHEKIILCSQ